MDYQTLEQEANNGNGLAAFQLAMQGLQQGRPDMTELWALKAMVAGQTRAWDMMWFLRQQQGDQNPMAWFEANEQLPLSGVNYFKSCQALKEVKPDLTRHISFLKKALGWQSADLLIAAYAKDFGIDIFSDDCTAQVKSCLLEEPVATFYDAPDLMESVFSNELCEFIQLELEGTLQPSQVIDPVTGQSRMHSHRACFQTQWLVSEMGLIGELLERRWAQLVGKPGFGEPVNLLCYPPGGEYKAHLDTIDPAQVSPARPQRTTTLLCGLNVNDDYLGGSTRFINKNLSYHLTGGDVLIFESISGTGEVLKSSLHCGEPVSQGVKRILSKWYTSSPTPYDEQRRQWREALLTQV